MRLNKEQLDAADAQQAEAARGMSEEMKQDVIRMTLQNFTLVPLAVWTERVELVQQGVRSYESVGLMFDPMPMHTNEVDVWRADLAVLKAARDLRIAIDARNRAAAHHVETKDSLKRLGINPDRD